MTLKRRSCQTCVTYLHLVKMESPQAILLPKKAKPWIAQLLFVGLILMIYLAPQLYFYVRQLKSVMSPTTPTTAIVFGAGLSDGKPGQVLKKRLDRTVELYNTKKIDAILVSGDNRSIYYNEPEAMRQYLIQNSVPENKIVVDSAGLRTNDTCWRAKNVFKINQAYLVTQGFHLPRATYLCNHFGIDSVPISAPDTTLPTTWYGFWRETAASWVALFDGTTPSATVSGNGRETPITE